MCKYTKYFVILYISFNIYSKQEILAELSNAEKSIVFGADSFLCETHIDEVLDTYYVKIGTIVLFGTELRIPTPYDKARRILTKEKMILEYKQTDFYVNLTKNL